MKLLLLPVLTIYNQCYNNLGIENLLLYELPHVCISYELWWTVTKCDKITDLYYCYCECKAYIYLVVKKGINFRI